MDLVRKFPLEALVWTVGLAILAVLDPSVSHHSLCPLKNLGFDFCPGCGLGRSIAYLMNGDLEKSFVTHPLGAVVCAALVFRIIELTKNHFILYGKSNSRITRTFR
jgi:Protein of unknown function (DUF2752)